MPMPSLSPATTPDALASGVTFETWTVATRRPDCDHNFGPVEPGRYARWVRRCKRCRAVATIRLAQE